MEAKYIRCDEKVLTLYSINELVKIGVFKSENNDLFEKNDLNCLVKNILSAIPLPRFGAVQKLDNVIFKSGKLIQLIKEVDRIVEEGDLSQLKNRKLRQTYIRFDVISLGDFYNPGLSEEEAMNALKFHL
jgi:hypothetical protein